jgi:hypothetical protein
MNSQNNTEKLTAIRRVRLGSPELRGTGISELTLISAVNESVKQAIRASENISLIAVNANLAAGRSGARAVGFCVVAGELRLFSDRMANTMHGWSSLIYALVQETARSSVQLRSRNKLRETGALSAKAKAALAQALEQSNEAFALAKARKSVRVIELQGLIRRAEKQRVTGEVIARSAMIESAYGGTMQPVLQQIAKSIDASIGNLTSHVRDVGQMTGKVAA